MQNIGLRFVYRKCGLLTYGNACKWGNKLGCWESQETWACRRESLEPRKSGTQPDNRDLPTSRGQNNSDKMCHDGRSVIYHISKVRYTAQSKFCAIHWNKQPAVNIFADNLIDAASVPLNLDQQCIERDGVWGRGWGMGGLPQLWKYRVSNIYWSCRGRSESHLSLHVVYSALCSGSWNFPMSILRRSLHQAIFFDHPALLTVRGAHCNPPPTTTKKTISCWKASLSITIFSTWINLLLSLISLCLDLSLRVQTHSFVKQLCNWISSTPP